MEAVIKLARQVSTRNSRLQWMHYQRHIFIQYFYETKQPQRTNFIGRQLSFHGNTLGTLALAHHPARRAPYEANLDHGSFHHVSPAFAKRFMQPEENEEGYVERLRKELDDKFQELGPDTVIGCK